MDEINKTQIWPPLLRLNIGLSCCTGERSILNWMVINNNDEPQPLHDLSVQAVIEAPDEPWLGKPDSCNLAPQEDREQMQSFEAPSQPGDYRLDVRVDAKLPSGQRLEFKSIKALKVRFLSKDEVSNTQVEINVSDTSLANLKNLPKQGNYVINVEDTSYLRFTADDQEETQKQSERLIVEDEKYWLPVPLELMMATDPQQQPEMAQATPHHGLLKLLQQRMSVTGLQIRMAEVQTRDILCADKTKRRTQALVVGQSLAFELINHQSGYLTLINIGTSGKAYLLSPNSYCNPKSAWLDAARHQIPGCHILSQQNLNRDGLELRENGPVGNGIEHLAAIITKQPLVDQQLLETTTPAGPFHALDLQHTQLLVERIQAMPADQVAIDLASFRVIE